MSPWAFITALAWIWGVLMALGLPLAMLSSKTSAQKTTDIVNCILAGILAWAWLLARYLPV